MRTLDAHGDRVEVRTLEATTMLTGYLDWPGAAQVCRVRSEVKARGEVTTEVSYAITSVPRERAGAATLSPAAITAGAMILFALACAGIAVLALRAERRPRLAQLATCPNQTHLLQCKSSTD